MKRSDGEYCSPSWVELSCNFVLPIKIVSGGVLVLSMHSHKLMSESKIDILGRAGPGRALEHMPHTNLTNNSVIRWWWWYKSRLYHSWGPPIWNGIYSIYSTQYQDNTPPSLHHLNVSSQLNFTLNEDHKWLNIPSTLPYIHHSI